MTDRLVHVLNEIAGAHLLLAALRCVETGERLRAHEATVDDLEARYQELREARVAMHEAALADDDASRASWLREVESGTKLKTELDALRGVLDSIRFGDPK